MSESRLVKNAHVLEFIARVEYGHDKCGGPISRDQTVQVCVANATSTSHAIEVALGSLPTIDALYDAWDGRTKVVQVSELRLHSAVPATSLPVGKTIFFA